MAEAWANIDRLDSSVRAQGGGITAREQADKAKWVAKVSASDRALARIDEGIGESAENVVGHLKLLRLGERHQYESDPLHGVISPPGSTSTPQSSEVGQAGHTKGPGD